MKNALILIPVSLILIGMGYLAIKSNTPVPNKKTSTQPAGQTIQTTLSGSLSLDEISKHPTEGDCWSAIDGKVYDLSSFTSKHPGGPVILGVCGKDGSELFHGKHGDREKQRVESMIIGSLAQ
ncbi:MAG: cytochrome b5-like heme/steroid binding domain-containing protein [Candidatus Roizmanbacteria bacterium]